MQVGGYLFAFVGVLYYNQQKFIKFSTNDKDSNDKTVELSPTNMEDESKQDDIESRSEKAHLLNYDTDIDEESPEDARQREKE